MAVWSSGGCRYLIADDEVEFGAFEFSEAIGEGQDQLLIFAFDKSVRRIGE